MGKSTGIKEVQKSTQTALYNEHVSSEAKSRNSKVLKLFRILNFFQFLLIRDKVCVIANQSDRIKSQRLLYREYVKKNLCQENSAELYFNPYTFLNSTTSLISKRGKKIVGTLSAISDSKHKLPADSLYSEELDQMRKLGFNLVEVSCFALDSREFKANSYSLGSLKKLSVMCALFLGLFNFVYKFTEATHFVIIVNPKHTGIYEFLGFKQFADIRMYPFVNKPAVPFILEVAKLYDNSIAKEITALIKKTSHILTSIDRITFHHSEINWYLRKAFEQFSGMGEEDIEKIKFEYPNFIWIDPSIKENKEKLIRQNTVFDGDRQTTDQLITSVSKQIN